MSSNLFDDERQSPELSAISSKISYQCVRLAALSECIQRLEQIYKEAEAEFIHLRNLEQHEREEIKNREKITDKEQNGC